MLKRLVLTLSIVSAATFSQSYADVQNVLAPYGAEQFTAALSAADPGDTIQFPNCSPVWAETVEINKAVTIKGNGAGHTIITRTGQKIFKFSGEAANNTRITGIEFRDCTNCILLDGAGDNDAAVKDIRIDNCKFVNAYAAINTQGETRGLVDHNVFDNTYALFLFFNSGSQEQYPLDAGSELTSAANVLFIEDNRFQNPGNCSNAPHGIVGNSAARAIIRYNTFDYDDNTCGWVDIIDAHDSHENYPDRGTLGYEIYGNKFLLDTNNGRTIHLRGGQHLVYDNYFDENLQNPIEITSYDSEFDPDRCNGNPWDPDDMSSTSCLDQINHSYFWGNLEACGTDMVTCSGGSEIATHNDAPQAVILNTHYFESPTIGYEGYTYPHPLTSAAGVNITPPTGLTVTESGATDDFEIVLTAAPDSDVIIALSSNDTSEGTVSPASITFTTENWATPKTVTVNGVDDSEQDGNQAFTIITEACASDDDKYNGLDATDIAVNCIDDDGESQGAPSGSGSDSGCFILELVSKSSFRFKGTAGHTIQKRQ